METLRITNEQIQADNNLVNGLEQSMKDWEMELAWIERDLIEQSLIDIGEGRRSARYLALETREKALKKYLQEAREKLGKVVERYDVGPLKGLMINALNQLRR